MKLRKLQENCYVMHNRETGWSYGQSYNSTVIAYHEESGKLIFGRNWQYSTTTKKHVQRILKCFFPLDIRNIPSTDKIRKGIEDGTYTYDDMLD